MLARGVLPGGGGAGSEHPSGSVLGHGWSGASAAGMAACDAGAA